MGERRRSHRRRDRAGPADPARRRTRALGALRATERRVDLPAVLLAGARARPRCSSSGSRRSTTSTTWCSSRELGDDIVAVARYDRVAPDEAEVAFAVADDQQRRGLATLLLEHLAGIARANGISTFVADTLPGNSKMLNVFAAAGWEADEPLRRGHGPRPLRDRADDDLGRRGRGAREPGRVGVDRAAARAALDRGDRREPPPGHDRPRAVPQPARVRLRGPGVPGEPDVGLGRRRPRVPERARRARRGRPRGRRRARRRGPRRRRASARRRACTGWSIISAGFAETGAEGKAAERELVALARSNGMRIIGPNCLGV